jgi:hypothetical protein
VTVKMTFLVEWDRRERVTNFRDKLERFKEHIATEQIKGHLPRGDVVWIVKPGRKTDLVPEGGDVPQERALVPYTGQGGRIFVDEGGKLVPIHSSGEVCI